VPYATVSDVQVDFGDIADGDVDKVETLLERAEARIKQAYPDLEVRMADGRTSLVLVKQVESEMVVSVLRNPNGWQSHTETTGPFSHSATVNVAAASGLLRLSKDQRALLGDQRGGRAFTVVPSSSAPHRILRRHDRAGWRVDGFTG
jgi:hypothetical protein